MSKNGFSRKVRKKFILGRVKKTNVRALREDRALAIIADARTREEMKRIKHKDAWK